MCARNFALYFSLLLLVTAVPTAAQEGHPVKGSWLGTFGGPGTEHLTDVIVILDWDGENENTYQLTEQLNFDEVFKLVENAFEEIPSAIGMNNHQGSKATENLQLMKDLARSLKKLDKFFIDSYTSPESRAFITMRQFGVKTEVRQIFLDHQEHPDSIRQKLNELLKLTEVMEVVVAIGHVKPVTYEILKEEIPRLKQEGYVFMNASDVVR